MLNLGNILQVTVSKDDTLILDGAGDKTIIEERTEQVNLLSSILG
jgi:chaperonin GroEL